MNNIYTIGHILEIYKNGKQMKKNVEKCYTFLIFVMCRTRERDIRSQRPIF